MANDDYAQLQHPDPEYPNAQNLASPYATPTRRKIRPVIKARGKAFVVVNEDWRQLPGDVQQGALRTFDSLWNWGGVKVLRAERADEGHVPRTIDLTDVIVRCFYKQDSATSKLKELMLSQITELITSKGVRSLESARSKVAGWNTKSPASQEVTQGFAMKVKSKVRVNTVELCICVTESVICLESTFGMWSLGRSLKKPVPVDLTLKRLRESEDYKLRAEFGEALGRVMAHEARHQLAVGLDPLIGLPHCDARGYKGLGVTEPPFWQPTLRFSSEDEAMIAMYMNELAATQGNARTEAVDRNRVPARS